MTDTIQIDVPVPVQTAPLGFHAVMDCADVDSAKIKDSTNIQNWVADILTKLGSTASGTVALSNAGLTGKNGYSAFQLFNTGSLTAHFMEDQRHIYIDIFAWQMFNPELVEASIKSFFGAGTDIKKILLPRNASIAVQAPTI